MNEQKELSRVDVNIEKMPIFFFGSEEKRKQLEKQIFESGKPHEVVSVVTEDGGIKQLTIVPSAVYGVLTEFDYDITTVVYHYIYEVYKKGGLCPKAIRIPFSDFPKVMEICKQGYLYKNIEESAKRIDSFIIHQTNYVIVKDKTGELRTREEVPLKLFSLVKIHHEERKTKRGKKIKKYYLELEIPDWVRNNIDNFYTTGFDIKKYFLLKRGRTRRLYRFLELIRYKKRCFISYEKLKTELKIEEEEMFHVKRTIRRTFEPMVKSGDLAGEPEFDEFGVYVTFSSIKKGVKKETQLTLEDLALQESLVKEMVERLGDEHSQGFYRKVVKEYPEELIYKCLSLTREVIETKGVEKSKGAIFTDILKREGEKMGLAFSG